MLSILRYKYGIPINDVFFSDNPLDATQHGAITYFVQAKVPAHGFFQFKTQVIDLSARSATLFAELSSSTRYKIRRAEREGAQASLTTSPDTAEIERFCDFFDGFAALKGLPGSNRKKMHALGAAQGLMLTRATDKDGELLVAHAYITDRGCSRLRLLYSASHFRATEDTEERNRIGRANRFLHWREIEQSKDLGFEQYDLGGIPLDQRDPAKNAIARFKSEFGGHHVIEYNGYQSNNRLVQHCLPTIRRLIA
jgi:hypothetical protein